MPEKTPETVKNKEKYKKFREQGMSEEDAIRAANEEQNSQSSESNKD